MNKRSSLITALLALGAFALPIKAEAQKAYANVSLRQEIWAKQTRNFRHLTDFRADGSFFLGPLTATAYFGLKDWYRNDDSLKTEDMPRIEGSPLTAASDRFLEKDYGISALFNLPNINSLNCSIGASFSRRGTQEIGKDRSSGIEVNQDLAKGEPYPTVAYESGFHPIANCEVSNIRIEYIGPRFMDTDKITLPNSNHYFTLNATPMKRLNLEARASFGGLRKSAKEVSLSWNLTKAIKAGALYGATEAPGYYLNPLQRAAIIVEVKK